MFNQRTLDKIQTKIGYKFSNLALLEQAFTRNSFSTIYGGENNEILEFFGDRILSLAVIRDFYELNGSINAQGQYHSSKKLATLSRETSDKIKNSNLADQISRLKLKTYLKVWKTNEKSNMKTKADLFEAIIGAVAIDSNWDLKTVSNVFHKMMYSQDECKKIDDAYSPEDYISMLKTELWKTGISKTENKYDKTKDYVECSFVIFHDIFSFKIYGKGNTEQTAYMRASERAFKIIWLWIEHKFIPEMSFYDQIQLLYSFGFISEPRFHFEVYPANSENSDEIWRCYGSFDDSEYEYMNEDNFRFESKELVCRAMLCDILQIKESSDELILLQKGQGLLKYILSKYNNAA